MESKRLFIGIPFKNTSSNIPIEYWKNSNILGTNKVSWTKPQNLHLTLSFLGTVNNQTIPLIEQCIENSTINIPRFSTNVIGTNCFLSNRIPQILYLNIEQHKLLLQLQKSLSKYLFSLNIRNTEQNFIPHLTIGRIKKMNDLTLITQFLNEHSNTFWQKEEIDRIHLYRSILTPAGPIYESIFSKALK